MPNRRTFLTATAATAGLAILHPATANAATTGRFRSYDVGAGWTAAAKPSIFWSPHADDELISMGIQACNHAVAGRNVLVILITQGASEGMLAILNGGLPDYTQGSVRHWPTLEGYKPEYLVNGQVTADTAGRSRWDEFQTSVRGMDRGYPGRFRATTLGLPEGAPLAQVKDEMAAVARRFPGADHKGYSWTDDQVDHHRSGQALRELQAEGVIDRPVRYQVFPDYRLQRATQLGAPPVRVVRPVNPGVTATVKRCTAAYFGWNPTIGAFGFGGKSSPFVATTRDDPRAYEHYDHRGA